MSEEPDPTPLIGRNAIIQMGGTAIGLAMGITTDINVDLIKEFALGSDKPAILASGNKSFKIGADMMYIDNTYASQVLAGTAVDFVIGPSGGTAGTVKITVKNVILNAFSFKADQKGIITGKITGEGTDWQSGTF
jgi:hypothetical protein